MTNAMQAKLPRQALKNIKIELFLQVDVGKKFLHFIMQVIPKLFFEPP